MTTVALDRFTPGRAFARFEDDADIVTTVEGSLGFVDISGFTALSERLAALGRVGAEELTEVLGRVFGEMIDLASDRGGTLLKFGGDALLLLYESEDHAVQAASAAVEMRAALRKAIEIPTSVGKVALKMSQGVHSGDIQLIRSRGVHTELVVAGPAASFVTEMEGSADASEIVVSDATRRLLPTGAATKRKGAGWLLRWRTPRVDPCGAIGTNSEPGEEAGLVPVALRDHLSSGTTESEHRQATVAFVEVVGIDDAIEDRGVFTASGELSALVASIGSIADEEGVTFLATDVDENACKVILVSGVPTTSIDEEGRMLRAVRRIADVDSPFGVKIGVNRGHVFSGEVGSLSRATYTIMGDTVNLAARMMAAAPVGSIYVAPQVVGRSTTLYRTEHVPPFLAKGKSRPVQALALGEEAGTRSARSASTVPYIGRSAELEQLRGAVEAVSRGRGGAFAVSGPTGIGKSRLVDEALIGAQMSIVEARSEPYGTANPYRPFRDPVRALLGVERGDNEAMAAQLEASVRRLAPNELPYAPLLGDIVQVEVDPTPESEAIAAQFRQDKAIDVLMHVLASVLEGPIAIVAEDMHWADAATQALLSRLVREADAQPWLVIQTCRFEIRDDAIETILLAALDDEETTALVHAATEAAPLRPDEVAAVVTRAAGNPLFALELVNAVQESGDAASLPTSLDGVVGSQVDALEPLARRVLRYLSVLGRSFRVNVAKELLSSQGIELDEATRDRLKEFLDSDGENRLQFRHAMVRDAAYDGLAFRKRSELHLQAGAMILRDSQDDGESVADILGLHFYLGGDAGQAWKYCRIAGDRNLAQYANPEAALQFERALHAARSLGDISDLDLRSVWMRLGGAREQAGMFESALDAYRQASRLSGDNPDVLADLLLRRAWVRLQAGDYVMALRESTQAAAQAADCSSSEGALIGVRAGALKASVRLRQGKLRAASAQARDTASKAESLGERTALAQAYNVIAWTLVMTGDSEAPERCQQTVDLYGEIGDVVQQNKMYSNLGVLAYFSGEWNEAITYYERARAGAERIGHIGYVAFPETNIGEVLVNQRRYQEAEETLRSAVRTLRATGEISMATFAEMLIARVHLELGDLERAAEDLAAVVRESSRIGYETVSAEASLHFADCDLRRGETNAAVERVSRTMSEVGEAGEEFEPLAARIHAVALARLGHSGQALDILDAALDAAAERDSRYDTVRLLEAKALVLRESDKGLSDDLLAVARAKMDSLGIVRSEVTSVQ